MLPTSHILPKPKLRYKYTAPRCKYDLTENGERRVINDEFYLQETPGYKGYTEKIFRTLFASGPMTIAEISNNTGIDRRAINGIVTFNLMHEYIKRMTL